jgi:hypothetical protein
MAGYGANSVHSPRSRGVVVLHDRGDDCLSWVHFGCYDVCLAPMYPCRDVVYLLGHGRRQRGGGLLGYHAIHDVRRGCARCAIVPHYCAYPNGGVPARLGGCQSHRSCCLGVVHHYWSGGCPVGENVSGRSTVFPFARDSHPAARCRGRSLVFPCDCCSRRCCLDAKPLCCNDVSVGGDR